MSFKKPKTPAPTPAETQLRDRQMLDIAEIDEEENRRIKRMLVGSRGATGLRGSGLRSAAGSGASGTGAAAMRAGGARGGRGGMRSLIL